MLKTEPARIKYGAVLRPQGKEANMVLPWVTVFWGGRKTLGSQEAQTKSFQLDRVALCTWVFELRRGGKKRKKWKTWRRGRKHMYTAKHLV